MSVKNPWPTKWLDQLASTYEVPEDVQEEKLTWLTILKREITDQLLAMEQEIMKAMNLTKESDGPYHYAETIEQDFMLVQEAKRCVRDWQQLHELFHTSKFRTLSRKKPEVNEDKKKQVKKIRDSYKKRWTDMKENWFSRNLASHLHDMREMAPVIKHVAYLVKAFKTRFDEEKRERALVDFSDLEHLCLQVLMDDDETNRPVPSKVALGFQKNFSEILIDEYQDTNLVQETILELISDQIGTGNMFMVGDVKQSIYRFRHAEPSLFIKKYNRFADKENSGIRIDLVE